MGERGRLTSLILHIISPLWKIHLTKADEPEPGVSGSLEPESLEENPRSRSHSEKEQEP